LSKRKFVRAIKQANKSKEIISQPEAMILRKLCLYAIVFYCPILIMFERNSMLREYSKNSVEN